MEYRAHKDVGFDPNTHINAVNEEYLRKKESAGIKKGSYFKSKIGGNIVNAAQGHAYPYKVGSVDEKRFYTVMINEGQEAVKLFYSNPEEYEKHRRGTVSQELKEKWRMEQEMRRRKEIGLDTTDDLNQEAIE